MNLLVRLSVLLFLFVTLGCTSVGIPGESETAFSNISVEYYSIADAYYKLENYVKAIEYYKKAESNNELATVSRYKMARCYAYLENWDEATKLFNSLLKTDSENSHLQILLAYTLAARGDSKKALVIYESLLTREYYDPAVLKNMILLYVFIEDIENAKKLLDTFKERFPEHDFIADLEEHVKPPTEELENTEETGEQS